MNILNICDSAQWDIVSYQALHTAAYLSKMGHNTSVLCPGKSRLFSECRKQKIKADPLSLAARFGFFKSGGWDIVHFYNPSLLNPLFMRKAGAASRTFVTQVKLGNQIYFRRLAALEPYIDRYIGTCNSVREEFSRAGADPRKTFLVPPCINIGRWESAMLIKPAIFHRRPYRVGTVSMDRSLKEQELFLRMAKEVLQVFPETHFMVVGLKDDRIRDIARALGISHKVDVLWDRTDVPEIMAMMHIFVKTSRREGMSMSLMEAQASGVACVVPRRRGLGDFIEHERNGVVVEPDSASSCALAVIHLISNPQICHSMSKAAFDYVRDNMSLPVVGNLLERLYQDALA